MVGIADACIGMEVKPIFARLANAAPEVGFASSAETFEPPMNMSAAPATPPTRS